MKITNETITVSSKQRTEMIDITGRVSSVVKKSEIGDGDVLIYCPHTTGAITINENADPSVIHDILLTLDQIIPRHNPGYRHSEGNSDSHCKSSIIGCSEQVLVRNNKMVLGTWQGIFFCEFDGPRSRKVHIQVRGQ
jgi:secondary thiamine-phosphate synthase enzyme